MSEVEAYRIERHSRDMDRQIDRVGHCDLDELSARMIEDYRVVFEDEEAIFGGGQR